MVTSATRPIYTGNFQGTISVFLDSQQIHVVRFYKYSKMPRRGRPVKSSQVKSRQGMLDYVHHQVRQRGMPALPGSQVLQERPHLQQRPHLPQQRPQVPQTRPRPRPRPRPLPGNPHLQGKVTLTAVLVLHLRQRKLKAKAKANQQQKLAGQ